MLRILLVDDHRLVRHGVRRLVVEHLGAETGEADSFASALLQLEANRWDVVILDLNLPDRDGLDLLKEIRQNWPATAVLVLSMHPVDQLARRVMGAGALGYVTKNVAPAELIEAIKRIKNGQPYVSDGTHSTTLDVPSTHEELSDREYQVLKLLGSGKTVSQVAASIGISVKTVSTYRARVLLKLGLKTNAELMRYAMREGLVE